MKERESIKHQRLCCKDTLSEIDEFITLLKSEKRYRGLSADAVLSIVSLKIGDLKKYLK